VSSRLFTITDSMCVVMQEDLRRMNILHLTKGTAVDRKFAVMECTVMKHLDDAGQCFKMLILWLQ
jgi:hypothetical protein